MEETNITFFTLFVTEDSNILFKPLKFTSYANFLLVSAEADKIDPK